MRASQKKLIVAGLKAGLQHLAMSQAEACIHRYGEIVKDTFLCYAIAQANLAKKCSRLEAKAARAHIMKMLDGMLTVRKYLRYTVGVVASVRDEQLFRKRWAEHMIKEFS